MDSRLQLEMLPQPDDTTCGPTCLHAVYRYFGKDAELQEVIDSVPVLETGGTIAVLLGCHALRRGYDARIYTYNLQAFERDREHELPFDRVGRKPRTTAVVSRATPVSASRGRN